MDELVSRLKVFIAQQPPSRRLFAVVFILAASIAFVLNSLNSGSATLVPTPKVSEARQEIEPASFYVHIVGQVKNPGVYSLSVGSRLFDAVVAAGGFREDADQSSVNLARTLTDGEQVFVLKIGASSSVGAVAGDIGPKVLSINRASESELESLPGVGPALAGRIVDWRTANGGFKKKEDLLNVGGIGDKLYAGIAKLVTL